ncbi:hypothetical protein ACWGI8_05690 [Streptomyces sp. NPDC054841]
MHAQAAPAPTARHDRAAPTLGLTTIVHRTFPAGTSRIDDPFSHRHFADLTRLYGVTHRPDIAERGTGNTFTAMAQVLLGELAPKGTPIDLAVVAHATPDLDCRHAAVTFLSEAIPGRPQVFTVSDCGSAAPFAALHLATEYALRHGHHQVALFVLDQATLPYDTGQHLAGDAGVALLLTDSPSAGRLALRQTAGIAPRDVADAVRAVLDELGGDASLPVIAGAGVDPARDLPGHGGRIVRAEAGYPASGTLGALATDPLWREGRDDRIAVVDYEPTTGDLSLCLTERGSR